mmetsp:Transcript_62963/g.137566  ORF Transcript_62963/g.137566 Transcript_62963/m.137566 type:complete len:267 (-) Transcript_62963:977-1777(-)
MGCDAPVCEFLEGAESSRKHAEDWTFRPLQNSPRVSSNADETGTVYADAYEKHLGARRAPRAAATILPPESDERDPLAFAKCGREQHFRLYDRCADSAEFRPHGRAGAVRRSLRPRQHRHRTDVPAVGVVSFLPRLFHRVGPASLCLSRKLFYYGGMALEHLRLHRGRIATCGRNCPDPDIGLHGDELHQATANSLVQFHAHFASPSVGAHHSGGAHLAARARTAHNGALHWKHLGITFLDYVAIIAVDLRHKHLLHTIGGRQRNR